MTEKTWNHCSVQEPQRALFCCSCMLRYICLLLIAFAVSRFIFISS